MAITDICYLNFGVTRQARLPNTCALRHYPTGLPLCANKQFPHPSVSQHVPATRPRPLAPSGMREEGMWSDAEREDGMWSDAEQVTDILKRSCRPLLSFFPSSCNNLFPCFPE